MLPVIEDLKAGSLLTFPSPLASCSLFTEGKTN